MKSLSLQTLLHLQEIKSAKGGEKMPQFHETWYGKRFFDSQLPKLIKEFGRIADALEKANELKEKENNHENRS